LQKLKITDIKCDVVTIPLKAPIRFAGGALTGTTRTIVRVETDEGITGLGETLGSEPAQVVEKSIKPLLLGADPHDLERITVRCTGYMRYMPFNTINMRPFAGVEMALWDIVAKAAGQPLCNLLGGKFRDSVAFSGYIYPRYRNRDEGGEEKPEEIANYCAKIIKENGYGRIEIKLGIFDPQRDVATVAAIRDRIGPNVEIGVDANSAWSPETAVRTIRKLEHYDLCNVEEPCRGLEASARVRRGINTPISTHSPQIPEVAALHAADVIVGDPHEAGGILISKKLIAAAEIHNLGYWLHSTAEAGVSMAAYLHIAASSPHIIHPSQGTYEHLSDDIILGGKHRIQGGSIRVPDKPGLGIELDENKMRTYHDRFLNYGEEGFAGYSAVKEADSLRPEWAPTLPQY
jgi:glucarate dehydratase